jgi:AI-2 transport protein TqsA
MIALLATIAIFMIMGFLKLTGTVLIPFVVAFLLSFVLNPAVEALVKIRIPRLISIIIVILVLLGLSFLIGLILYESVQSILRNFPKYQQRYLDLIDFVSVTFNLPADYFQTLELSGNLLSLIGQVSSNLVGFLGNVMLVLIFMLFLFLEKPFIRRKLVDAIRHDETERVARIFADITKQVGRYLMVKFFVSSLTAVVVGIGFTLIGVDFAFYLGGADVPVQFHSHHRVDHHFGNYRGLRGGTVFSRLPADYPGSPGHGGAPADHRQYS